MSTHTCLAMHSPSPEGALGRWKAFPKFYTEVIEIWSLDEKGNAQTLIAEIPMDPQDDLKEIERRADVLASLPLQVSTLQEAPAPPNWSEAVEDNSRLAATLLHWFGKEYLPWYRMKRPAALKEAGLPA